MMNGIKRFAKYIWYIIRDVFMIICFGLDVVGMIVSYQSNINIPQWIYTVILIIGFIVANYKIFVDNAPEITVNTSLLNKYPYKVRSSGDNHVNLMVNYNFYMQNSSNNAGVIEKVEVELLGFSKCKDDFLLERVGVKFKEFFIADEEIFTPMEFMKNKVETEFPIIIEPKQLINKILILYIDIDGESEEDYQKTIEWMQDIEFQVIVDVKNNNIEKQNKYKIKVSKEDIEKARVHDVKSNEEVRAFFEERDKQ